jgi:hypothetical protein
MINVTIIGPLQDLASCLEGSIVRPVDFLLSSAICHLPSAIGCWLPAIPHSALRTLHCPRPPSHRPCPFFLLPMAIVFALPARPPCTTAARGRSIAAISTPHSALISIGNPPSAVVLRKTGRQSSIGNCFRFLSSVGRGMFIVTPVQNNPS